MKPLQLMKLLQLMELLQLIKLQILQTRHLDTITKISHKITIRAEDGEGPVVCKITW